MEFISRNVVCSLVQQSEPGNVFRHFWFIGVVVPHLQCCWWSPVQRLKSGNIPLYLLSQVLQARVRVAAETKDKRATGRAPHVIFSSFLCVSIFLSHIHTKADNLKGVSHSISCCDRGQFSPSKYFDFTEQYAIQGYRMKNITKLPHARAQGFSNLT